MAAPKRTCIVCGTKYDYCGTCPQYNRDETWRNLYCSENCRSIYHTYDGVKAGTLKDEDARQKFDSLDLSKLSVFSEPMRSVIRVIMNNKGNAPEPVSEPAETVEAPVATEPDIKEETIEEPKVAENTQERTNRNRNRNKNHRANMQEIQ